MDNKDDIFRFEDFLGTKKIDDLKKMKETLLKEGIFNEDGDDELINHSLNPYKNVIITDEETKSDDNLNEINEDYSEEIIEVDNDSIEYYKLFKDKSENFICDIAIEGVNQDDTEARLIIESNEWSLMFKGEIKNGKCIIPIKKLNILNEGQIGNIKLEINADGNLFTPWEDKFIVKVSKKVTVKVSKKVTVKLNETKSIEPKKTKLGED